MRVKDLVKLRRPAAITRDTYPDLKTFARRMEYAVLIDLKDGETPRLVESASWEDDARALVLSVE